MFSQPIAPTVPPELPFSSHYNLSHPHWRRPYGSFQQVSTSDLSPHPSAIPTSTQSRRSTLATPHRFALPIHRTSSHQSYAGTGTQIQEQISSPEHMLRRKTPTGTLASGYDGTPNDWASAAHANKHQLLPMPATGLQDPPWTRAISRNTQQLPIRSSGGPQRPQFGRSESLVGTTGAVGPGNNQAILQRRGLSHLMHGYDSMLHQLPVQQPPTYFVAGASQIPTVLQQSLQTYLGPTASNDEGPYGPYWPDGAYIPYRPAALRDPRFLASTASPPWMQGAPYIHDPLSISGWHRGNAIASPLPLDHGGPLRYDSFHQQTASGRPAPHRSHSGLPFPQMTCQGFVAPPVPTQCLGHGDGSDAFEQLLSNPSARQDSLVDQTRVRSAPEGIGGLGRLIERPWDEGISLAAEDASYLNVRLREKVFSWAHSVYVDLLTSLHQSRRNNQYHRQAGAQQHSLGPSIYPKPPRQPGLELSASPAKDSSVSTVGQARGLPGAHHKQNPHQSMHQSFNSALATSNGESKQMTTDGNHASLGLGQAPPVLHADVFNPAQHPWPSKTASPFSTYSSVFDVSATPTSKAMVALELMTQLCEQSEWCWVDGILLGGCLAYGLKDYAKALRWYSKILEIDSSHTEAISNLAATLLALNRREEAERYWLHAVKLRPSYFEAVEHLIGLLCSDHRSKEAVDIIEYVERSLRYIRAGSTFRARDVQSETDSEASGMSSVAPSELPEKPIMDYECDDGASTIVDPGEPNKQGYGSSGYAIPGSENGRILALVHAKGNMLYALGDNVGAARAFEDAVLVAAGRRRHGIKGLIQRITSAVSNDTNAPPSAERRASEPRNAVLLPPEQALQIARVVFPGHGELPGLKDVASGMAKKAAISTTSNSLLSLAKISQDGMTSGVTSSPVAASGVHDILALYYLSLSLQPSPSTANNVGILLASIQQAATPSKASATFASTGLPHIPGVVPGTGVALALAYYNYGLNLDARHAHLYTNLGSLLKDIGQLAAAIKMYEQAVAYDGTFDIALANLANAVKDQGRISDAIGYYKRAVAASPDFAEAVCGLANALNSVCSWSGRGGVVHDHGKRDRWHVNEQGMLIDGLSLSGKSKGWIRRVVDIVDKQLGDGERWGQGMLKSATLDRGRLIELADDEGRQPTLERNELQRALNEWADQPWEGARVVRLIERVTKQTMWRWYHDRHVRGIMKPSSSYSRPRFPSALSVPTAPTVLPFHTFTCPLSARQIRLISQRNGLRISCSTLRSLWLPATVYSPPTPPAPYLKVGYVSSDFNNHPLAHLMQSVFGFHDPEAVKAYCYATTATDNSVHRRQIEREAPVFVDASHWPAERLVTQIVEDGIHILINLNGYTRGARNEVFAARPAPIQMSFMGFAGTLGAEWCDYLLADRVAVPPETLRPGRNTTSVRDVLVDESLAEEKEDWMYSENIIFARDTFFCCDHRQSAPDSSGEQLLWHDEEQRRWKMRKEIFPNLADDAVIFGNFNQLYKIEPTTFRSWLRVLARVPHAILWLLRFPDLGESNLKHTAQLWAGAEVASRIIFTDVAPKHLHISRARVCDLFLDTPECNAHTTAADVLWSGTPLLTFPRYRYKMCSRMAASILKGALPKTAEGAVAADDLIVASEDEYEDHAVRLGQELTYTVGAEDGTGRGRGRLSELRKILYESRWTSGLFDTRRWVRDLEEAYQEAWRRWVAREGGDIWL